MNAQRLRRGVLLALGNVLILVVLLVLIEGVAGWTVAFRKLDRGEVAERLHTRYDAELGWVSLPNVRRLDMYGPGNHLHTNSRGFRGRAELSPGVPFGRIRVVCSGDSFTLGYGVSDDATWCHRLGEIDPRLETANMGQGGYGIDQAYLWYRRDARELDHDVHVFAFISDDFRRMTTRSFIGYPKPILAMKGDSLTVENVPVPKRSVSGWLSRNAAAIQSLSIVEAGSAAMKRLGGTRSAGRKQTVYEQASPVLPAVFADLKRLNESRGSKLVLVYLPSTYDLDADGPREWSAFLEQQSKALGITFIDLYPQFRAMPADSIKKFFLRSQDLQFKAAAGHLNRAGNDLVARVIHEELVKRGIL